MSKLDKTKNTGSKSRDQYTVVLEDLRSNFKVFGENLGFVREKVNKIDTRLERVEVRLDGVEAGLNILKGEVALIRHNQITRDEFKLLEARVLSLENKFSHS